jgi:hypothetical protein
MVEVVPNTLVAVGQEAKRPSKFGGKERSSGARGLARALRRSSNAPGRGRSKTADCGEQQMGVCFIEEVEQCWVERRERSAHNGKLRRSCTGKKTGGQAVEGVGPCRLGKLLQWLGGLPMWDGAYKFCCGCH